MAVLSVASKHYLSQTALLLRSNESLSKSAPSAEHFFDHRGHSTLRSSSPLHLARLRHHPKIFAFRFVVFVGYHMSCHSLFSVSRPFMTAFNSYGSHASLAQSSSLPMGCLVHLGGGHGGVAVESFSLISISSLFTRGHTLLSACLVRIGTRTCPTNIHIA